MRAAVRDTKKHTVVGKQLEAMNKVGRTAVTAALDKTLSNKINKTIKVAGIFAKYKELVTSALKRTQGM